MVDTSVLERMGLTKIEAKVYLALLQDGSQAAGAITKTSGVHRRTVYDAISRLIEKGLISYIRSGNTKVYQAAHPERLMELLKDQEQHLEKELPGLERLYDTQPERHETVFFRGKKGLKTLFDDQLKTSQPVLMFGATPAAVETLKFYFPQYDRIRQEKRIDVKLLFDQRAKEATYIKSIPRSESRMLRTATPQDVVTCIYGDSVAIITFSEKPFGILIREQAVAQQYRNYFAVLWKKGANIS